MKDEIKKINSAFAVYLEEWNDNIKTMDVPKALQKKHAVAVNRMRIIMQDLEDYLNTARPVGRPGSGITKTSVRKAVGGATDDQLAKITEILKGETEISPLSPDVEDVTEMD